MIDNKIFNIPHDPEAEQGALGCCMLGALEQAQETGLTVESFHDERCKRVWLACESLHKEGMEVNQVNVAQVSKEPMFCMDLPDKAPTSGNLTFWLPRLRGAQSRRAAFVTHYDGLQRVASDMSTEDILGRLESDYYKLSNESCSRRDQRSQWRDYVDRLESAYPDGFKESGIQTGLFSLDSTIRGLKPGSMNIIAARPGRGKTALAVHIAHHCASAGQHVVYFSYEMPFQQVADRLVACRGGIDVSHLLETGNGNWQQFTEVVKEVGKLPICIEDKVDTSIRELRAIARRYAKDKKTALFVVDYLTLVPPSRRGREVNRVNEVGELSRELKKAALETGSVFLVLTQMNRNIEETSRKPRLSDLRESGAIEQDADTVTFLHLEDENETETVEAHIRKNRHGRTGSTNLGWRRWCNQFTDPVATGTTDNL